MNRTFANIKTNVGNNVQDTSSGTSTIIANYINNIYFDVLRRFNWDIYNYDYSLTTVSGTQDYILPRDFGKELYVRDSTNKVEIPFKSLQSLAQDNSSSLSESSTVSKYSILEKRYNNQPSSSSVITVVSDNGDDSSQKVVIRGISGNVEKTDTINLTATSSAAGSVSFSRIISISKSALTTGSITLTSNSGAITIAEMSPEEIEYKRKFIRVFNIPTGSYVIEIPYKITPMPMVSDHDVPLIPDDIIEHGATMMAWRYKRQFSKAEQWERTYEKLIINAIWDQENSINQVQTISVEPYSRAYD